MTSSGTGGPPDGRPMPSSACLRFRDGMREICARRLDAGAVQVNGVWSTWRHAQELGEVLADLLADIPPGPVALVLRNRSSGVAALLGLLGSGVTTVLVSPIQPPAAIAAAVARCGAAAVVADAEDCSAELRAVAVTRLVALGAGADGALTARLEPGGTAKSRSGPAEDLPADAAVVVPTSGTTGPPKLIPLSWEVMPMPRPGNSSQVVINGLSNVTITGLMTVLRAMTAGRPVALLERLEVHAWAALVREHRPEVAGLPPAAMRSLLDSSVEPADLASIKSWPTGSAPVPVSLQEEFEDRFGIPVLVNYGATEFGGSVAGWTLEDHRKWAALKRGSVGRARKGVSIRVADPADGTELAPGLAGVLEVRSPRAPVRPGEWIRTNDLARIDEDGFLYISGRVDDVIVRGGFKVPLGELEEILAAHPAVRAAGAVGLSDARLGQVPAAAVRVVSGEPVPSEQELKDWVRRHAAPYWVPVLVLVVDELPRTASHKISRPGLRELLEPLRVPPTGEQDGASA